MKIAVLASPDNTSDARKAMIRLEAEGNETVGLKFSERWRAEPRARLELLMTGASHILCVLGERDAEAAWFAYMVGFARGKAVPLVVYATKPHFQPDPWMSDVSFFPDLDAIAAHYAKEAVEWASREARRMAKAALLELGISWHGESMAQCVRDGDTKAVELFIASGFPPDVRDKSGVPMLCLAARSRHHSVVEVLLDSGADIDAQSDDRGYSPLMDAAQQGDETLAALLLRRWADTDLQSKDGQTALVLAVGRGDAPIVSALLRNGADPDLADKLGLSARKYAKLFHNTAIDAAFTDFDQSRSS